MQELVRQTHLLCCLSLWCLLALCTAQLTSVDNYKGVSITGSQISQDLNHLRFHRCFDEGEAYAGALLITREHFLSVTPEQEPDLSSQHISIETASFQFMETRKTSKLNHALEVGAVVQTLDLFDLSVIHLSAYERSLRHHGYQDRRGPAVERMVKVADDLELRYKPTHIAAAAGAGGAAAAATADTAARGEGEEGDVGEDSTSQKYLSQTLVLLPWAGSNKGVGNSKTAMRAAYLKACFWSFYSRYKGNIVIGVPSEQDAWTVKEVLQLPALDVWVLPHVKLLPLALLAEARVKFRQAAAGGGGGGAGGGEGDGIAVYAAFQYVFFSESDQLLVMRHGNNARSEIYPLLNAYPRRVLVPHRLIPFAHEILKSKFNINVAAGPKFSSYKGNTTTGTEKASTAGVQREDYQCCLERQNCESRGRNHWYGLGHPKLKYVEVDGLMVAMGNSNFRAGTFRPCALGYWGGYMSVCP